MDYLIYGFEVAPSTGTPHLQCYVRFKKRKELATAAKFFMPGSHLAISIGTEEHNRNYCSKDKDYKEFGTYNPEEGQQGRRSDLKKVAKKILDGVPLRDVALEHPETFIKMHAGIEKLKMIVQPPPPQTRQVTTTILWGDTGTGKTHRVLTLFPNIFSVVPGRDPWQGYSMEKEIIFDEFKPEDWPITDMNRFLDKWTCKLSARYNNKLAYWNKVFICANSDPMHWYSNEDPRIQAAFRRRITSIYLVKSKEDDIPINPNPSTLPNPPPPPHPHQLYN